MTNNSETCAKAEEISNTVESFLSVPSIGVLMRLSPVISLVDEYSFYIFHRANYDRGFLYMTQLCS
jgi:hypothetical protein